jgi:DNA-binding transcriptional LysR family regulator
MDTSLLDTFCEVAKRGSITAAAESLGYTQSAVSRQVAALEAVTRVQLLHRRARGVELTEHGRCLLPHAEAVLNRLACARRDLDTLDRLDSGRLRVGAFPTANALLIPAAMAEFAVEHPGVSLSLVEGTTPRQLANLDLGDVDLAVVSAFADQSLDHDRFEFVHLLRDSILLALPQSHRLANRRSVRLVELTGESWIAGGVQSEDRALGPRHLFRESEPTVDFQVAEWTAKLGLVAAGLGITLVPSLAAAATRADIALVRLHPREQTTRNVYAAGSRQRTRSPASDAFVAMLVAHARMLERTAPRRAR